MPPAPRRSSISAPATSWRCLRQGADQPVSSTGRTSPSRRGSDFREPGRYQEFTLEVQSGRPLQNVEFRVHLRGGQELWVDRINLHPGSLALEVLRDSCAR